MGLKWRLKNSGMEGDEHERGVFNCAEVAITARLFSIQIWTLENSGDLCVPLSPSYSINLNYDNEFNWAFKPAAISELYNWARLQPACRVNA